MENSTKADLAFSIYWDYAKNVLPFASKGGMIAHYKSKSNGIFYSDLNSDYSFRSDAEIIAGMKRLAAQTPEGMTATPQAFQDAMISFINQFEYEKVESPRGPSGFPSLMLNSGFGMISSLLTNYASAVTVGLAVWYLTKKK